MNRRAFFGALIGATCSSVTLVNRRITSPSAQATMVKPLSRADRRRNRFLNLTLRTHEDKEVRFYDDLLKGKTVLINFMYTKCTDDCPLTTANLARVQSIVGERMGREVFIYSISVDPEYDTPDVLRTYVARFKIKPGWLFLSGAPTSIAQVRSSFGDDPTLEASQSNHLGLIRLGVEPLERWGGCPTWSTPETIVRYLSWIEPRGRRPDSRMVRY